MTSVEDNHAQRGIDPAYKAAFFNRFHRKPTSERDFKILPMIYEQQQAEARRQARVSTPKQPCFNGEVPKEVRVVKGVTKDPSKALVSPVVSILRKSSTPSTMKSGKRVVRFTVPDSEFQHLTIEKQRSKLEARKHRLEVKKHALKKQLVVFSNEFRRKKGRLPIDLDWMPCWSKRMEYALIKEKLTKVELRLKVAKQLQAANLNKVEHSIKPKHLDDPTKARSTDIGVGRPNDAAAKPTKHHADDEKQDDSLTYSLDTVATSTVSHGEDMLATEAASPKVTAVKLSELSPLMTPKRMHAKVMKCHSMSPLTPTSRQFIWNNDKWTRANGGHNSPRPA